MSRLTPEEINRRALVHTLNDVGDEMDEAVELLALWFSRFQGYTAGTPENMVVRTSTLLAANGRPVREPPVQA